MSIIAKYILGSVAGKVVATGAVIAIGAGSVFVYKQVTKQDLPAEAVQTESVVVEQQQEKRPAGEEADVRERTEQSGDEAGSLSTIEPVQDDLKPAEGGVSSEATVVGSIDEYVFKPKGVLSGLITDIETGEGAALAEISIHKAGSRTLEAVTDANGFYYFEKIEGDGEYRIRIVSKEYVGIVDWRNLPVIFLKKGTQGVKHFQLQKACMMDLEVVDEEGEPVSRANIYVTFPASRDAGDICEGRQTSR